MEYKLNFPFTNEVKRGTVDKQYKKVVEEVAEVHDAYDETGSVNEHMLEECMDLLHAAEGLLAMALREHLNTSCPSVTNDKERMHSSTMFNALMNATFNKVLFKNYSRGYYEGLGRMVDHDNRIHMFINADKINYWSEQCEKFMDFETIEENDGDEEEE